MAASGMKLAATLGLIAALALGPQLVQAAVVVKAVSSSTNPSGFAFRPSRLDVSPGAKVAWKSMIGTHTVTSISKNWSKNSTLSPGDPTAFTFNQAGTFRYRCTIHSSYNSTTKKCTGMCGKVVVG